MKAEIDEAIKKLAIKTHSLETKSSLEAMQYAQAVLNLTHAKATIENIGK